jgi:hypothetical protein
MADVLSHNERAAATWGSGGRDYDRISEFVSDALTHLVNRIAPQPGERFHPVTMRGDPGFTKWVLARGPLAPSPRAPHGRIAQGERLVHKLNRGDAQPVTRPVGLASLDIGYVNKVFPAQHTAKSGLSAGE